MGGTADKYFGDKSHVGDGARMMATWWGWQFEKSYKMKWD